MPYREKTAWLSLIAMAVTFGPYFGMVAVNGVPTAPMPNFRQLGLYAVVCAVQLAILGVGHLYLRSRSPEDARTPPDERDREIMSRAANSAYYVLMSGVILVGVIGPFRSGGWTIVNGSLFALVAAEAMRQAVSVISYRRQA